MRTASEAWFVPYFHYPTQFVQPNEITSTRAYCIEKQECIPVGCVPPARYHTGVSQGDLPDRDPHGQRPPWKETPRQRPLPDRDPSQTETPHGQRPLKRDPPDRDSLDRDPPDRDPSWTETPLDRNPLDRDPSGQGPAWSCDVWCMLAQRPATPPPNRDHTCWRMVHGGWLCNRHWLFLNYANSFIMRLMSWPISGVSAWLLIQIRFCSVNGWTNQNQLTNQSQHLLLKTHGFYRGWLVSSIVR